ncbi:hypothetical protein [Sphaerisporangium sp. NPDC051011]|uniref:hypothetical protein n=1 Tax=Sphaerisporangium sp. NPDC051011 TaxID=3155792 RepID=UPI0033E6C365
MVPLCDGETISSFEVADWETERLVWKVSEPNRPDEQKGMIVLGDARGFSKQENSLTSPVPPHLDVGVRLSSERPTGSAFLWDEVPENLADSTQVVNWIGKATPQSEESFRQEVDADYC